MKIVNISPEAKASIREAHEEIEQIVNAILKENSKAGKLTKQRDALVAEIKRLESADLSDASAMRTLGDKRTALGLVDQRIAELPPQDPDAESQLFALLGRTMSRKALALAPTMEAYESEIAEKLLPYCTDRQHADAVARQTQAYVSLVAYITWRASVGRIIPDAKRMLASLEEILSGELNWSFTPKA